MIHGEVPKLDFHLSIPTRLESIVASRKRMEGKEARVESDHQSCKNSALARSDHRDHMPRTSIFFSWISLCSELSRSFFFV
jgi:hypothetical protein